MANFTKSPNFICQTPNNSTTTVSILMFSPNFICQIGYIFAKLFSRQTFVLYGMHSTAHTHSHTHTCTHTHTHTHTHIYTHIHTLCVCMCMCVWPHICTMLCFSFTQVPERYIYIYIYTCMHVAI